VITWDDVVAHAPALAAAPPAVQLDVLGYTNGGVALLDVPDASERLARIFLAAHFASVLLPRSLGGSGGGGGASGPISSESAGDLERTYATSQESWDRFLGSTQFGAAYLSLVRGSLAQLPLVAG
jgi:hypothetical protein